MKLIALLGAVAIALDACTPPSSPPGPDASDASAGDLGTRVCGHLAEIGCPQARTCAGVVQRNQGVLSDFKPACLLAATSPAAANACGTVHCRGDGGSP